MNNMKYQIGYFEAKNIKSKTLVDLGIVRYKKENPAIVMLVGIGGIVIIPMIMNLIK